MSQKSRSAKLAERVRRWGFDRSYVDRDSGNVRVGCSQCEALVISGYPTHETGCPNIRSADDDE